MTERRKYPRFELMVKAKYSVMDSNMILRIDKTKNVSAEGICFESNVFLKTGTHVNLEIDLGDGSSPVRLIGEVKWSYEIKGAGIGEKKYLNGVKLMNVPESDESRFLKYYCNRIVEKLSDYLNKT